MGLRDILIVRNDDRSGVKTNWWINPDIIPLPPSRRTWGRTEFLGFWSIPHLCISSWTTGSVLVSLGLSTWETVAVLLVGQGLVAYLAICNGWIGGKWHIGFTVAQRAILGVYGSFVGIVMSVVMSIIWYGSQAWLGGLCISVILGSCSSAFLNMPNTLPEGALMQTRDLISFILFHLLSVPFMLVGPEKIKHPVILSNVLAVIVMISLTLWTVKTGEFRDPSGGWDTVHAQTNRWWTWLYGITSILGSVSSGILNHADFTRFARRQGVQTSGTLFGLFVPGTIIPLLGIVTASMNTDASGQPIWNPVDLLMDRLARDYTFLTRAACFFCAAGLITSQLAQNVLGNAYAAGMGLAGLFPKYVNIKRGCIIAAMLSWAFQPWQFYYLSSMYLDILSDFSVFLMPLTGIMISDFFLVRRQRIQLTHLYTRDTSGSYYFTYGVNWRALFVWLACVAPAIPGMIDNLQIKDRTEVTVAVLYYRGFCIFGFAQSLVVYWGIMRCFPPKGLGEQDEVDVYGTFASEEAIDLGITPFNKEFEVEGERLRGSFDDLELEDLVEDEKEKSEKEELKDVDLEDGEDQGLLKERFGARVI
ncbi:thiamine transporter thi7 [Orbilia oligospora]|uniref:Thiamine transporter thi7 n=1 Tax=Orbilia oligospora TaxID=2813651 RepID=A0A7C8PWP9_ORBOL|nr:thiamine transporter thi7 [Orbilia oligospora]KAF3187441.1 thiamine transporter thi7 [Orbilia oligospora]KAF3260243.1 thiamine transporter thi7 [Orbilia oligospora]KAF3267188.1 thiamine transporter thi7 [Orbilia oligospora]KAF3285612.1 thiamine transporter thi7 [Orbilia oligospora]